MMPQFCAVLNCRSNSLRDKISFYRFPSETDSCKFNQAKKERRELWINALCRNDLTETKLKNQRVCEKHFLSGCPAPLENRDDPDWIPTQNLGRPDDIRTLEPDRHLSEETRKLHIAPLLDHNYASKPPNLKVVPLPQPSTSAGLSVVAAADVPAVVEEVVVVAEDVSLIGEVPMMEGLGLLSTAAAGLSTAGPTSDEERRVLPLSPPVSHSGLTPEPLQQSSVSSVVIQEEIVSSAEDEAPIKTEEEEEQPVRIPADGIKEESQTSETNESHPVRTDEGSPRVTKLPKSEPSDDTPADNSYDSPIKPENSNSWQGEDYVTRCICGFDHDDGYMISCDKCMVWQHVDCMEIERGNIPEEYLCELCLPRRVDRAYAVGLQRSKKKLFDEMLQAAKTTTPPSSSDQSNSDGENIGGKSRRKTEARTKKNETVTGKRKKTAKNIPPIVKKKKTLSKREIRPVRRDYPAEDEPTLARQSGGTSDEEDLRDWIDSYEEAITNHYSPELRARISVLKSAEIHSPHRLLGAHSARARVKLVSLGHRKIVVAGCHIPNSQPIMEIRGKYMLSKYPPHPTISNSASGDDSSPPRPPPPPLYPPTSSSSAAESKFVFHHRLVGPGSMVTGVQVDTSTYGNSARFLRSSCTPNSQILHCIEKGTLHLYVVSTKAIDSRKEVTLPHRPGVGCALGENCHLLGTGKRRSRKQILVERVTSREPSNVNNNNNYKDFPQRKRSSSSERPFPSKATKGSSSSRQEYNATTKVTSTTKGSALKKSRQTLRSAITSQLRRNETKFGAHASIKKP